jgi:hypothetical protein
MKNLEAICPQMTTYHSHSCSRRFNRSTAVELTGWTVSGRLGSDDGDIVEDLKEEREKRRGKHSRVNV